MEKKRKKMGKKRKKNEKKEENCNFPKNEKLQFSSGFLIFFHVFFIFLNFFYHVSSFLLPVVQKFSEK